MMMPLNANQGLRETYTLFQQNKTVNSSLKFATSQRYYQAHKCLLLARDFPVKTFSVRSGGRVVSRVKRVWLAS